MEIEYSNFEVDPNLFGKNELVGIVDRDSNFIYNKIYDIKKPKYSKSNKVKLFLNIDALKNKTLLNSLKEEFEITQDMERKSIGQLSSGELIKVLVIKLCLSDAKVIILENVDSYLNGRDMQRMLKTIKSKLKEIDKTVLFSTNKVDNIVSNCTKFIIASEDKVVYEGTTIDDLPEKTEIMKFVDLANKKGAKIEYHRDPADLLKAIYRSVKK